MTSKDSLNSSVLVVDDDPVILEIFRENLEDLSFNVFTASSAKEALKLDMDKIDCIITDVIMPEMTGTELINILESKGHHKILFFMTGYKDYPREELNKFKPRAIIFKPFDIEEAALLIKNHMMRLDK